MDLKGKKVTVIGAAKSGIAAAQLVLEAGGVARITDARPLGDIERALAGLRGRGAVTVEAGGHTAAFIQDSHLVVASPGVWKDAPPLGWARDKGIPVMGEIEFAWRFCRKPVIAVTGSNGKTTTATLIARVLEAAGRSACLCGNVGVPFSQVVLSVPADYFVVEISSFQLELIETFRPHMAVLLNFSQNHLDRHPDMQDYFNAKKRIFMNQTSADHALLNADAPLVYSLAATIPSRVSFFRHAGTANPNFLAVLEVARILGIPGGVAEQVCAAFPGVEHRMEKVAVLDGVEYINDSKSTTVEAARWALERMQRPTVMIAGGSDKCLDYAPLRELMRRKVSALVVIGVIKDQLRETFGDIVPVEVVGGGLEEAVACARRLAVAGGSVLFSPMTASFDMFDNFEHRGKVFKQIVNRLGDSHA